MKDVRVFHRDEAVFIINPTLLDKQKAWKNLEKIKEAHQLKLIIYEMMTEADEVKMLRSLAKDVTEIEFELQELWGFSKDIKFHRFWTLPLCECPKLDNEEWYPTGRYVVNSSCPVHGKD